MHSKASFCRLTKNLFRFYMDTFLQVLLVIVWATDLDAVSPVLLSADLNPIHYYLYHERKLVKNYPEKGGPLKIVPLPSCPMCLPSLEV